MMEIRNPLCFCLKNLLRHKVKCVKSSFPAQHQRSPDPRVGLAQPPALVSAQKSCVHAPWMPAPGPEVTVKVAGLFLWEARVAAVGTVPSPKINSRLEFPPRLGFNLHPEQMLWLSSVCGLHAHIRHTQHRLLFPASSLLHHHHPPSLAGHGHYPKS